jgi:hypothetical protein
MKRLALLSALALAAGLVTAGCSSEDRLSHDEFVEQADKICADGNGDLSTAAVELGADPSDEDVSSFVTDTLVPNIQDQHDALEDLAPPEDDQDAFDDMLSSLQDSLDGLEDDPMTLIGDDVFADANAAAQDLGLEECGSQ